MTRSVIQNEIRLTADFFILICKTSMLITDRRDYKIMQTIWSLKWPDIFNIFHFEVGYRHG